MKRLVVAVFAFTVLAGPALAQGAPGGVRFCKQYASSVASIAADAIKKNPACLNPSKGMHPVYQMHFSWCMRTPRNQVEGAADNIMRLAKQCTTGRGNPGNRGGPRPMQGVGPLGHVWNESEAGWQGTWRRVGNSNAFKATWTHPSGRIVRADLTIGIAGNRVTVIRRDTFGPAVGKGCRYSGMLHGNAVSGSYSCDWARGPLPWSAHIR